MDSDIMSAVNSKSGGVTKSGMMYKAAAAKGKDVVRGLWKKRYFVLKAQVLYYYKNHSDALPVGHIPLRGATVHLAEEKTGKASSIRISQAKPIFNYLYCDSQKLCNEWLYALKAACEEAQEFASLSKGKMESLFGPDRLKEGRQNLTRKSDGKSAKNRGRGNVLEQVEYSVSVSHETKPDFQGKCHVFYTLQVQASLPGERPWHVEARFKDMLQLSSALQPTFPKAVARFPKRKGWIGSAFKRMGIRAVDSDASRRAEQIQVFWAELMRRVARFVPKSDSAIQWVYAFLGINDYERMLCIERPPSVYSPNSQDHDDADQKHIDVWLASAPTATRPFPSRPRVLSSQIYENIFTLGYSPRALSNLEEEQVAEFLEPILLQKDAETAAMDTHRYEDDDDDSDTDDGLNIADIFTAPESCAEFVSIVDLENFTLLRIILETRGLPLISKVIYCFHAHTIVASIRSVFFQRTEPLVPNDLRHGVDTINGDSELNPSQKGNHMLRLLRDSLPLAHWDMLVKLMVLCLKLASPSNGQSGTDQRASDLTFLAYSLAPAVFETTGSIDPGRIVKALLLLFKALEDELRAAQKRVLERAAGRSGADPRVTIRKKLSMALSERDMTAIEQGLRDAHSCADFQATSEHIVICAEKMLGDIRRYEKMMKAALRGRVRAPLKAAVDLGNALGIAGKLQLLGRRFHAHLEEQHAIIQLLEDSVKSRNGEELDAAIHAAHAFDVLEIDSKMTDLVNSEIGFRHPVLERAVAALKRIREKEKARVELSKAISLRSLPLLHASIGLALECEAKSRDLQSILEYRQASDLLSGLQEARRSALDALRLRNDLKLAEALGKCKKIGVGGELVGMLLEMRANKTAEAKLKQRLIEASRHGIIEDIGRAIMDAEKHKMLRYDDEKEKLVEVEKDADNWVEMVVAKRKKKDLEAVFLKVGKLDIALHRRKMTRLQDALSQVKNYFGDDSLRGYINQHSSRASSRASGGIGGSSTAKPRSHNTSTLSDGVSTVKNVPLAGVREEEEQPKKKAQGGRRRHTSVMNRIISLKEFGKTPISGSEGLLLDAGKVTSLVASSEMLLRQLQTYREQLKEAVRKRELAFLKTTLENGSSLGQAGDLEATAGQLLAHLEEEAWLQERLRKLAKTNRNPNIIRRYRDKCLAHKSIVVNFDSKTGMLSLETCSDLHVFEEVVQEANEAIKRLQEQQEAQHLLAHAIATRNEENVREALKHAREVKPKDNGKVVIINGWEMLSMAEGLLDDLAACENELLSAAHNCDSFAIRLACQRAGDLGQEGPREKAARALLMKMEDEERLWRELEIAVEQRQEETLNSLTDSVRSFKRCRLGGPPNWELKDAGLAVQIDPAAQQRLKKAEAAAAALARERMETRQGLFTSKKHIKLRIQGEGPPTGPQDTAASGKDGDANDAKEETTSQDDAKSTPIDSSGDRKRVARRAETREPTEETVLGVQKEGGRGGGGAMLLSSSARFERVSSVKPWEMAQHSLTASRIEQARRESMKQMEDEEKQAEDFQSRQAQIRRKLAMVLGGERGPEEKKPIALTSSDGEGEGTADERKETKDTTRMTSKRRLCELVEEARDSGIKESDMLLSEVVSLIQSIENIESDIKMVLEVGKQGATGQRNSTNAEVDIDDIIFTANKLRQASHVEISGLNDILRVSEEMKCAKKTVATLKKAMQKQVHYELRRGLEDADDLLQRKETLSNLVVMRYIPEVESLVRQGKSLLGVVEKDQLALRRLLDAMEAKSAEKLTKAIEFAQATISDEKEQTLIAAVAMREEIRRACINLKIGLDSRDPSSIRSCLSNGARWLKSEGHLLVSALNPVTKEPRIDVEIDEETARKISVEVEDFLASLDQESSILRQLKRDVVSNDLTRLTSSIETAGRFVRKELILSTKGARSLVICRESQDLIPLLQTQIGSAATKEAGRLKACKEVRQKLTMALSVRNTDMRFIQAAIESAKGVEDLSASTLDALADTRILYERLKEFRAKEEKAFRTMEEADLMQASKALDALGRSSNRQSIGRALARIRSYINARDSLIAKTVKAMKMGTPASLSLLLPKAASFKHVKAVKKEQSGKDREEGGETAGQEESDYYNVVECGVGLDAALQQNAKIIQDSLQSLENAHVRVRRALEKDNIDGMRAALESVQSLTVYNVQDDGTLVKIRSSSQSGVERQKESSKDGEHGNDEGADEEAKDHSIGSSSVMETSVGALVTKLQFHIRRFEEQESSSSSTAGVKKDTMLGGGEDGKGLESLDVKEANQASAAAKPIQQKPAPQPKTAGTKGGKKKKRIAIISLWNKRANKAKEEMKHNIFSKHYDSKADRKSVLHKGQKGYGKALPGSKSAMRAEKAKLWVKQQIGILLTVIKREGSKGPQGHHQVNFGKLFTAYQDISDTLVGMLRRARKYKVLTFEGDMLYQGVSDKVVISLLPKADNWKQMPSWKRVT